MKFCQCCGKELRDEATVCTRCGFSSHGDQDPNLYREWSEAEIQRRRIRNKRKVITVCVIICAAVALFFAVRYLANSFRANKIMEELSGETFELEEYTSYSTKIDAYIFDDEGNCEEYNYYNSIGHDDPLEYSFDWSYRIRFKNNTAYVVLENGDQLKIKYDEEGEIMGLYDPRLRETLERR